MAKKDFSSRLHDAVENYYHYNPDTLMPLMMVALAVNGKLKITAKPHKGSAMFCVLAPRQIEKYDWVVLDPALRKRIKQEIADNHQVICAEGIVDDSIKDIYDTFYQYDTKTVVQEYHHRIGRLIHHTSNEAYEEAHRQYATLCLVEAIIDLPPRWLKDCFLNVANHILVKSGLQPERPRLQVARTLCALLEYDGKGTVYNPFAGCAIAAAMLQAGNHLYVDGDVNDKLFAAARLLIYGKGCPTSHVVQRDSTKWIKGKKIKYALSTYRGYIDGKSAFDFCLSQCFDTLDSKGRYAGIISPKDFFENQSTEIKEALKRDWVDKIVLLPFGEVAILINANKKEKYQGVVRFFDLTHPMLRRRPVGIVVNDDNYAEFFNVSDVSRKGFLKSFIIPEIPKRDGFEIIKLGDIVKKIKRQTYSLARIPEDEQVLAFINRTEKYNMYKDLWMNDIDKRPVTSLFEPAYHLKKDCLITNKKGNIEPRLFDADNGSAFFEDGYAFEFTGPFNAQWLMTELNEPYVLNQLHPYGMDEMVPEPVTEDQILSLQLYREVEQTNDTANQLPTGFEIINNHTKFIIHRFLGHGSFGFAYTAQAYNMATGEEKEVVLKEFFPYEDFHREGDDYRAVANEFTNFDIDVEKKKFHDEAEIMQRLGNTPNSHIVPAEDIFECKKTDTSYYVMPFYHSGSLEDLQNAGTLFTEDLVIKHVVRPLCRALHLAHQAKVLHLDIKPENILVDDSGDAVLTDFGVAKQYDDEGSILNRRGVHGTSDFAGPEMRTSGAMVRFGPQPDIFGLSATIYNLITQSRPHPIKDFSDEDEDLRELMNMENCSEPFINAVIAGLQASASSRPENAQAFLNLFPGCEDIKLD